MTKVEEHGFKPGGYAIFEIESITFAQWCPGPDGQGQPTQVHMEIRVKGLPTPLVMRFKGPDTLGKFIQQMQRHRCEVWPHVPRV